MMIQRRNLPLAILISLLALSLRFYMAYNGFVEPDEPHYVKAAVQYNAAIREGHWDPILLSTFNYEHPQFNKLVYAVGLMAAHQIPTDSSVSDGFEIQIIPYWPKILLLRLISVFFGTGTVFLVSLINPLAGFLLAVHTYAIKYTSVVYLEALPQFCSFIALIAALKSKRSYQTGPKNWKKWGGWLILSSLCLGMTAASKYMYAVIGFVIVLVILIQSWKTKIPTLVGLAGWGVLSLGFFFLLDPVLWHAPIDELVKSVSFSANYSVGTVVTNAAYPFWQPIKWLMLSIPQQLNIPHAFFVNTGDYLIVLDSLIFVLALAGLPALFKRDKVVFIWLMVGMAFLLLWGTKWPQYILLVLAPYCICAAYGFEFLRSIVSKLIWRKIEQRVLSSE